MTVKAKKKKKKTKIVKCSKYLPFSYTIGDVLKIRKAAMLPIIQCVGKNDEVEYPKQRKNNIGYNIIFNLV
jgi:hypothetical protein